MSRYRFELAGPADDSQLQAILAATPMPGPLRLCFLRRPSYFQAAVVEGRFRQVVAARDLDTGGLVGFGSRAVSPRFINGQPASAGYLSSLRLLPEHRGGTLIARGYAFFRRLHADQRAELYVTTVAAGNQQALATIASGRGGLPAYHPWGKYHTLALSLGRRSSPGRGKRRDSVPPPLDIRPATPDELDELLEFLRRAGSRRQFFGQYQADDFLSAGGMFRGLEWGNLLLARRRGRLVGCLGGWDQSGFRQTVVDSYGWPLRWLRGPYNLAMRCLGGPRLPRPGEELRCWLAALPVVEDDQPDVFARLLATLRGHLGRQGGQTLLLGLHERDPLLPAARRVAKFEYTTLLFVVCWPDGDMSRQRLDQRPPYLELGQL